MTGLILAAGSGRRLGGISKPLIEIGGQPLIVRLIRQMRDFGVGHIVAVLGYQKERVAEVLQPCDVQVVENPCYDTTDNLISFCLGADAIQDDCILAHADLIIEDKILKQLLDTTEDLVMCVDPSSVDEEAMKIQIKEGKIENISKMIPSELAYAQSIPLMKFTAAGMKALKISALRVAATGPRDAFLERAILNLVASEGFAALLLHIKHAGWFEIDTPDDLGWAKNFFENQLGNSP